MAEQLHINDVLCYVSTARQTLSSDTIVQNAVAFYSSEQILKAKKEVFGLAKEKPMARKACPSHPNPSTQDIKDVLDLYVMKENGNFIFPKFVAHGHNTMPPAAGFDAIANILIALREEIVSLREEVTQLRTSTQRDHRSLEEVYTVAQDVTDIKTLLHQERAPPPLSYAAQVTKTGNKPTQPATSRMANNGASRSSNGPEMSVQQVSANQQRRPTTSSPEAGPAPSSQPTTADGNAGAMDRDAVRGNEAEWQLVDRRNRRKPATKVAGTRSCSRDELSGVERDLDFFLGGCETDTTPEKVMNYIKNNNIAAVNCVALVSKVEWYRPFKVTVKASDRNLLMTPEFWPRGVFIRKFYAPRTAVPSGTRQF